MKLIPIPKEKYEEYRLSVMFDCYKWDPQFLDNNTVAKYALVLTEEEYEEVKKLTEMLDEETIAAEQFLNNHLECAKELQLSKEFHKEIRTMRNYDPKKHIRLMRYDFHPVENGEWAISEVNSDVPGGYAEASLMPLAAIEATGLQDCWFNSFGDNLVNAIMEKTKPNGTVMLVHCTSYSDDRQVMQYLGDRLEEHGIKAVYGAADHVNFEDGKAFCILDGNEGEIDVIVRFTPLEWVKNVKPKKWQGYFNTETPSCNHPIAIFAQTKKFPLVWDELEKNGVSMKTWRKLLPETIRTKDAEGREGFILKPVYGRVGEDISIKEACSEKEYKKIMKAAKRFPNSFVAQKKFKSVPLKGENDELFHVCLGSYTVNGKQAGFYARISKTPRIDSNAADIPVLIERRKQNDQ